MCFPNQRMITVKRESLYDRKAYFKISQKSLQAAMNRLSGNALKLYLYFCANADEYSFYFRSKDFYENIAKMSEKTYQKVFKELIEEGYLVQEDPENGKNTFTFYENSIKK